MEDKHLNDFVKTEDKKEFHPLLFGLGAVLLLGTALAYEKHEAYKCSNYNPSTYNK